MNILSIQSHVVYGHVGNAAAVFCMQRLGVEVWPIHTVQFSNHTGYGEWTGKVFDGAMISSLVDGIEARGILPECSGVLSGYAGSRDIGEAILKTVRRVRRVNPDVLYCCDPVMGDYGRGIYVQNGIPEFMKDQVVPLADIITPNQFELEYLSGQESCSNQDQLIAAVQKIQKSGPQIIMVTSLNLNETPADHIDVFLAFNNEYWLVRTPKFEDIPISGTGDTIASLFFAHYLKTRSPVQALENATASIFSLLKRSLETQSREIQIIRAQDEIIAPTWTFKAQKL